MSARRPDTSSKRKRTTPQKLKNRKLFAVSENDLLESAHFSRTIDGENQDSLCLSQFSENLHTRENVPKSLHQSPSKKESLTETPQNKENMPGKYDSSTATAHRGRGRPKGSKNKTFPVSPTRVYSVREGKSPVYSPSKSGDIKQQNGVQTPHRGRGRPKGSTKVKPSGQDIPRRSRGRPKGSKNKKPSRGALIKLIPGPRKVGRGRPRKLPMTNEGETPKRGRGRPKGSLNKIPSAKKPVLLSVTVTHEKKKRGRPKKIVLHHSAVMPLTPKRPRGRPKSTGSHVPVPSDLDIVLQTCPTETVTATHEKRKRGRPKKIVLHHSAVMSLTPKRPRGRPKSTGNLLPVQSNLLKLSEYYSQMKEEEEDDHEDDDDDIKDDEDDEDLDDSDQ